MDEQIAFTVGEGLDEYQRLAVRTARGPDRDNMPQDKLLAVYALGLAGEAGEFVELIKKHIGHGHELHIPTLLKEMGDVLWYLAALCDTLKVNLGTVAVLNINKLKARYPDGYSNEASINREEEK